MTSPVTSCEMFVRAGDVVRTPYSAVEMLCACDLVPLLCSSCEACLSTSTLSPRSP